MLDTATIPQTCPIPLAGVVAIIATACGVVGGVIVVAVQKKENCLMTCIYKEFGFGSIITKVITLQRMRMNDRR